MGRLQAMRHAGMESKMDQHQNQIETFEAFDHCENIGSNPAPNSPIGEIIEA